MAKTKQIVDGKLEITTAGPITIETLTHEEVVGKKAEAQTKVDHLQIDLVAAQTEVTGWDDQLAELDS